MTNSTLRALIISIVVALSAPVFGQQDDKKPNVSEGEAKAAKAVQTAADPAAKLSAAEAFVKKYPRSSLRKQLANYLVDQIVLVKDPKQKLALADKFENVFTDDSETDAIKPAMLDAYVDSGQLDDAFATGERILAKHPNDVRVLSNLAITATEQAKKGSAQYVTQGAQHGAKAIQLIEADQKPADLDDATWARYKTNLPKLYQEMAVISMLQQNTSDSKAKFTKASQLNPADPFNFLALAGLTNDEYQSLAKTYQSTSDNKVRDEMKKKLDEIIDSMIENYAKAAARSEGSAYKPLHDQAVQDMTAYYKYRHNGSTDGMQQLIDKYKLPATP